jgi:hypothetical protein
LRDLEKGAAYPEPVADMNVFIQHARNREIFTELS